MVESSLSVAPNRPEYICTMSQVGKQLENTILAVPFEVAAISRLRNEPPEPQSNVQAGRLGNGFARGYYSGWGGVW